MKRYIVALVLLLFAGCGDRTPGPINYRWTNATGLWAACDRGHLIYGIYERGVAVVPNGCPDGKP